jgi:hypothetical protein
MPRIKRVAIDPDVAGVAMPLLEAFGSAVATLAKALQRTQPKFVGIAVMRLKVIRDGGGGYDAFGKT